MPVDPQIRALLDRGTGVPATHTLPVVKPRSNSALPRTDQPVSVISGSGIGRGASAGIEGRQLRSRGQSQRPFAPGHPS